MRILRWFSCLMLVLAVRTAVAQDGFQPLFDGKTLAGWKGDTALWSVEDGMIVGLTKTKKLPPNSFLATEKSYKNFVLKVSFKLRNHNSGVQVRSKMYPDFHMSGYQADIAESTYTGILYEEGGRGIIQKVDPKEVAKHFKRDDWNQYVITCNGPKITQELNGFVTVEYTEKDEKKGATEGLIGFQLHAGPPMKVFFKDVQIKELP